MNSPDNPSENALPPGVEPSQVVEAVEQSGYPLQSAVASYLTDAFHVTEEWGYRDREGDTHRTLDVFAFKRIRKEELKGSEFNWFFLDLALLIECKRSSLPYVFFRRVAGNLPDNYPPLAGVGRVVHLRERKEPPARPENRGWSIPVAEILKLQDLEFVSEGPPTSAAFSRLHWKKSSSLELSGTDPFHQLVLPLGKAQDFAMDYYEPGKARRDFIAPTLVMAVAVVDAPIAVVSLHGEDTELEMRPWVRIIRQERGQRNSWEIDTLKHFVVDVVHWRYFRSFVEQRLLPFAETVAARAWERIGVLERGDGSVPDISNWGWQDVRP